jgi:hypothetical protein
MDNKWDDNEDLCILRAFDGCVLAHVAFNVCNKGEWDWQARTCSPGPTTFGSSRTRHEAKEAAEAAVKSLFAMALKLKDE